MFSRYVVAWMVAERENSALAKQLFVEAILRYGIEPGKLLVHQDRGAPMTAHGFTELLAQLGVDRSYSRPRVSNDNPFFESQFHTLKYQPDYPGRFRHPRHGRQWCAEFFGWYNDDHHHEGLNFFTPADVFFGRVDIVAARRQEALAAAFASIPNASSVALPSYGGPRLASCSTPSTQASSSSLQSKSSELGTRCWRRLGRQLLVRARRRSFTCRAPMTSSPAPRPLNRSLHRSHESAVSLALTRSAFVVSNAKQTARASSICSREAPAARTARMSSTSSPLAHQLRSMRSSPNGGGFEIGEHRRDLRPVAARFLGNGAVRLDAHREGPGAFIRRAHPAVEIIHPTFGSGMNG